MFQNNLKGMQREKHFCTGTCDRKAIEVNGVLSCVPGCTSGEEYRDETGYCSLCAGLTPDNSPISDTEESRSLCEACGGVSGTPDGQSGLYCMKQ